MLIEQQRIIQEQAEALKSSQAPKPSQALNKIYQEKLRLLNQKHFAKSSEKNSGQAELHFLNEVEMLHAQEALKHSEASKDAQNEDDEIEVPAHTCKRRRTKNTLSVNVWLCRYGRRF